MEFKTFEEFQTQIQDLYQKAEYATALDLATVEFEHFPEHRPLLYYWRITMSARLGDVESSLGLLHEALDEGIWYGEVLLRKSPSLETLQDMDSYEKLVALNNAMRVKEQEETFPIFTLRPEGKCQAGEEPCPLMLGLHANASNTQGSMGFWRPAATAGWLVAAPQSTQAIWNGAFVWDDRQITEKEIINHYNTLVEGYSVDEGRIVLAGHSMGGEVAMWMALTGAIQVCGFIAIGPGGPHIENTGQLENLIRTASERDLRGFIIAGELDSSIPKSNLHNVVEKLKGGGISCQLEIISGAGHEFSPEYESALLRALEYVTG